MEFQNCILINFNGHTDGRTDKPKAICPFNFYKVGGKKIQNCILMNGHTDWRKDKPIAICPLNFYKVGRIKS